MFCNHEKHIQIIIKLNENDEFYSLALLQKVFNEILNFASAFSQCNNTKKMDFRILQSDLNKAEMVLGLLALIIDLE